MISRTVFPWLSLGNSPFDFRNYYKTISLRVTLRHSNFHSIFIIEYNFIKIIKYTYLQIKMWALYEPEDSFSLETIFYVGWW